MIKLGQLVKDRISNYKGIVTSRTEFLYGCVRICVTSQTEKKDGEPVSVMFDEDALEPINEKAKIEPTKKFTGGDRNLNPNRKDMK